MSYAGDADAMLEALRQTLIWERARGDLDNATVAHFLSEAARTAEHDIAPLDIPVDRDGALRTHLSNAEEEKKWSVQRRKLEGGDRYGP